MNRANGADNLRTIRGPQDYRRTSIGELGDYRRTSIGELEDYRRTKELQEN